MGCAHLWTLGAVHGVLSPPDVRNITRNHKPRLLALESFRPVGSKGVKTWNNKRTVWTIFVLRWLGWRWLKAFG